ncbi:MAG: diphosphate--fructose-6-phosphate 1-phosphotransferase [Endomicrobium sp.]|jgi:pyrophosphate--fructose-6-phosphate 1-phosphotransferase|nr:diphosphate--fructose-6-phosphate 1-phosphotransferase [Endomicrobium sp.]
MPRIDVSELQVERQKFKPILPKILKNGAEYIKVVKCKFIEPISNQSQYEIQRIFKNTYGFPEIVFRKGINIAIKRKTVKVAVVFSGGQAPGGHNVICGLFDGLKKVNKKNILIGYIGGLSGILKNEFKVISERTLRNYRNTGGFDFITSGRTKIETSEQFNLIKEEFLRNKVDALVIVGGDDSNTNAAVIAEYFAKEDLNKYVVGVPKTIDGDLKNKYIETSFGFDTATKIYAELVGNICKDVNSSRKYWHFIRLMGRSASHVVLEVAFKTHPNIVLIGEEILSKNMTLSKVIKTVTDIIVKRSQLGKNFGVVLIPEGIIEFIPEMRELLVNINNVIGNNTKIISEIYSIDQKIEFICSKISSKLSNLMNSLPFDIASQLISDRDPHGNIRLSLIETEKFLINMVHAKLLKLRKKGKYQYKFSPISHFFGYEGRCGIPSNFDANYAYALGYNAAILVLNGLTGYLSNIKNLTKFPKQWECCAVPLTTMMAIEKRISKNKPVIQKSMVDLQGKPFINFIKERDKWILNEDYISPGPIQYFGPSNITNMTTKTLQYEKKL